MLSHMSPRGSRYRHVVFTGARGARRVVNYAPAASPAAATMAEAEAPEGFDESGLPAAGGGTNELAPLTVEEEAFVRWLFERAGLDAADYRNETLRRRLPACLRAVRAASPVDARRRLQADASLLPVAVGAMVIGVTSFFRDPAVFEVLASDVLPSLARRAGSRVWSVGCSTGEELYSVAILMAEAGLLEGSQLLGTDCRAAAVRAARAGVYDSAAVTKHVPVAWLERYFEPAEPAGPRRARASGRWRVRADLRGATQWRAGDVTRVAEPGGWDLILCRNAVMYLRCDVAGRVWERLEQSLRPGGFLVLGRAERPAGAQRLSLVAPCVYRRDRG